MLITEFVDVRISNKNIKHYQELGYNVELNQIINVLTLCLMVGSQIKVEVKCDYCGKHFFRKYKSHIDCNKKHNKDSCKSCAHFKAEETNLKKYGVKSVLSSKECREKIKQTNLERYGFEYSWQNKEVREKIKQTNLERYGDEHVWGKNSSSRIKCIETKIKKYGTLNTTEKAKKLI